MFHSTETVLPRVQNDIHNEMQNRNVVVLVKLDLSAAFAMIDHNIFSNVYLVVLVFAVLTTLNRVISYLKDRTQCVAFPYGRSADSQLDRRALTDQCWTTVLSLRYTYCGSCYVVIS